MLKKNYFFNISKEKIVEFIGIERSAYKTRFTLGGSFRDDV